MNTANNVGVVKYNSMISKYLWKYFTGKEKTVKILVTKQQLLNNGSSPTEKKMQRQ